MQKKPTETVYSPSNVIVEALVKLLEQGDDADRCYAARALGSINATGSATFLRARLLDEDVDVCIDSAEALGKLCTNDNEVVNALNDVANFHPDDDAKLAAAQALACIGNTEAIEILLDMLEEPDSADNYNGEWNSWWDIQRMAVICLGEKRITEAVPLLQQLLQIGDQQDIEQELLKSLAQIGGDGTTAVIGFLQSENPRLRRRAARALSESPDNEASIVLFKLLKDSDDAVRVEAIEGLGRRQAEVYILDILQLINDASPDVQVAAIGAAESIALILKANSRYQLGSYHLLPLLDHSQVRARVVALKALHDATDELPESTILQILRQAIESENIEEIEAVSKLLSGSRSEEVIDSLISVLVDDSQVASARIALIRALACISPVSDKTWGALRGVLLDSDSALRLAAMETLAKLIQHTGDDAARALLVEQFTGIKQPTESDLEDSVLEKGEAEPELVSPVHKDATDLESQTLDSGRIPVVNISDHDLKTTAKEASAGMDDILSAMNDLYPGEEQTLTNEQSVFTSTLDAIQQNNVKQTLGVVNATSEATSEAAKNSESGDERLRSLIGELPDDMKPFSEVVEQHLETGGRLKLSRKKIAKRPQFSNRVLAARALGKTPSEETVSLLRTLLIEPDPEFQVEVITSIGRIAKANPDLPGLAECHGPLSTLLLAGTPELRHACALALGQLRHQAAIPVLRSALQDDEVNIRIAAIEALVECISSEAHPFSRRDHVVLDEWQPKQVLADISKMLNDVESGVVFAALNALALYQYEGVLKQVVRIGIQNSALVKTAARTIKKLGFKQAEELLMPFLVSDDGKQRALAIMMVGDIYA